MHPAITCCAWRASSAGRGGAAASTVSVATRSLLESEAPSGIYHCVNSGVTTWYELGEEIARLLGRKATLLPVKVADVTLRARRPQYAALSNDKLRRAGVAMPTWQDAVKRYLG